MKDYLLSHPEIIAYVVLTLVGLLAPVLGAPKLGELAARLGADLKPKPKADPPSDGAK